MKFPFLSWAPLALVACAAAPPTAPTPTPTAVASATATASAEPAAGDSHAPRNATLAGGRELFAEFVRAQGIPEREKRWVGAQHALDELRALADPRTADDLAAWLGREAPGSTPGERIHFQTLAAFALGELGDERAVPALAERLRFAPMDVYRPDDELEAPLVRDDSERVVAARLLGELALLHPEHATELRKQAEKRVVAWLVDLPAPHANGLRALAFMHTEDAEALKRMRGWADPTTSLPKVGQQPPFPEEFATAQSALRYEGALRDPKGWDILKKQLGRRPKRFDATMDALMSGGSALLGMSLRALGVGAAQGFSEWGDSKAFPALLKYASDPLENEQSRSEACNAMSWVATDAQALVMADKLDKWRTSARPEDVLRAVCFASGLAERPHVTLSARLERWLDPSTRPEVRRLAARALGRGGFDSAVEQSLRAKLASSVGIDAGLALVFGGTPDGARTAATSGSNDLAEAYRTSLAAATTADLADGRLDRMVENALAVASAEPPAKASSAYRDALGAVLHDSVFDSGPHSLTRMRLRHELARRAKQGSASEQSIAIATLELMREQGSLLALSDGSDAASRLAKDALARLAH